MNIPTEPIGSIPPPLPLIEAIAKSDGNDTALEPLYEDAVRDTIARFEATGSPFVTGRDRDSMHSGDVDYAELLPGLFESNSLRREKRDWSNGVSVNIQKSTFDDTTTTRDTAFAKIRSRVLGTALAAESLGGR